MKSYVFFPFNDGTDPSTFAKQEALNKLKFTSFISDAGGYLSSWQKRFGPYPGQSYGSTLINEILLPHDLQIAANGNVVSPGPQIPGLEPDGAPVG